MNAWLNKLYETFIATGYYNMMIDGLKNTVIITLGALLIVNTYITLVTVCTFLIRKRLSRALSSRR